jgi:hypothetical protein
MVSCEHLDYLLLLYETDYNQNQAMPKDREWNTLLENHGEKISDIKFDKDY